MAVAEQLGLDDLKETLQDDYIDGFETIGELVVDYVEKHAGKAADTINTLI